MCYIFIRKKNNKKVILNKKLITSYINRRYMRRYRGGRAPCYRFTPFLFTSVSAPATCMRLTTSHAWYAHSCGILPPILAYCQSSKHNNSVALYVAPSCSPLPALIGRRCHPLATALFSQPCHSGGGVARRAYLLFT